MRKNNAKPVPYLDRVIPSYIKRKPGKVARLWSWLTEKLK